jgi:hypothetical protein
MARSVRLSLVTRPQPADANWLWSATP